MASSRGRTFTSFAHSFWRTLSVLQMWQAGEEKRPPLRKMLQSERERERVQVRSGRKWEIHHSCTEIVGLLDWASFLLFYSFQKEEVGKEVLLNPVSTWLLIYNCFHCIQLLRQYSSSALEEYHESEVKMRCNFHLISIRLSASRPSSQLHISTVCNTYRGFGCKTRRWEFKCFKCSLRQVKSIEKSGLDRSKLICIYVLHHSWHQVTWLHCSPLFTLIVVCS